MLLCLSARLENTMNDSVDVPNDEELVLPRSQGPADVTDAEPDQAAQGDTDSICRVPVANDCRLLFACEPHARDGDWM